MRRSLASLLAVAALAIVAVGCGDDAGSKPSTGSKTTTGSGSASIDVWDVPASVECKGATSTTVQVHYETSGAARRKLLVDGAEVSGTDDPSASLEVPVHCDALPHTFVLFVFDGNGGRTSSQKILTTNL